ncbi:MAG: hypothetical protein ABUR63_06270 [Verrucomicrobiota bacterium]
MTRLRPATLVLSCLAAGGLSLGVYAMTRARDDAAETVLASPTEGRPVGPSGAVDPGGESVTAPPRPPQGSLPQLPFRAPPPAAEQAVTARTQGSAPKAWVPLSVDEQDAMNLARHRFHLTRRADELVFETLKIDEGTRAAVRMINETQRPVRRPAESAVGVANAPDAAMIAARRDALEKLLGSTVASTFHETEAAAMATLMAGPTQPNTERDGGS